VDLELPAGRVLALLGPNGAGKTTLLATMAGLLPRVSGELLVDGVSVANGRAAAASRAGVVLVPDDRALFTRLTVAENLRAAAPRRAGRHDDVVDLFPALRRRWKLHAGALSGGEQQMLAMARALVQRPRALLIDEMSMGLAPVVVEQLLPVVRRVADETGAVVVLVEQHVHLALEFADDAIVMVHGEVRLRGSARELAADAVTLEAAYLGANA
jgi:branched-chain amino acid transport system ATP-binding protein